MPTIDLADLENEPPITKETKKDALRRLYPAIHEKLTAGGWSAKDMVDWLGNHGISMSVELFRVYLRELDRENGYVRSTKTRFKGVPVSHEKVRPCSTSPQSEVKAYLKSTGDAGDKKERFSLPSRKRFEHPSTPPEDLLK